MIHGCGVPRREDMGGGMGEQQRGVDAVRAEVEGPEEGVRAQGEAVEMDWRAGEEVERGVRGWEEEGCEERCVRGGGAEGGGGEGGGEGV